MFGIEVILIFFIVSLITFYVVNYSKSQRIRELAAKLPGHEGLSLWESIYFLITLPREQYINKFVSYIKDEYPFTKVWFLNKLMLITKDADFINKVFNMHQTYNKPDLFYKGFMTTKGLITLAGSEHKRHRKLLNKAFTPKMMQRLPDIFDEKSKKIIGNLSEVEDAGEFELLVYIGPYSFESFGKSNMNFETDNYGKKIIDAYERFSSVAVDYLPYSVAGIKQNLLSPTKLGKRIKSIFDEFNNYFDEVIKFNKQNENQTSAKNFVDILLDPENGFTEEEIRDQLIMVTMGAYETSARTLSMILMMLGMHQNVQNKLLTEIDEVYNEDKDANFTIDFLQKFPYLEMVVKETMRLFAVVPMVSRETSKEVEIDGYLIPKNTTVIIPIYTMQRDKKYWGSDADKFRPERFEEEIINPHAWVPFTGGGRICIGNRYAMIAMKVFLINFFRTYTVNCSQKFEDIQCEMAMTLNFLTGYKASIHRR